MRYEKPETFLLLGGGGMVGQQIAYAIAEELNPRRIIICALEKNEAEATIEKLKQDFPKIKSRLRAVTGNVFIRHEWNPSGDNPVKPGELTKDETRRKILYQDIFGKLEDAYPYSELVGLIEEYAPDVIIDSINTATAISYQDVYTASERASEELTKLKEALRGSHDARDGGAGSDAYQPPSKELIESAMEAFEEVLISQSVPQLVRHVLLLNKAMREAGTHLYLKIGTTGTGGMGLNIPYTHSEDKPSATLMEKTAIAFAHTGLMFLMARTLGGPAVKEFKPAAMIGYSDISFRGIKVKSKGKVGLPGKNFKVYASRTESLGRTGRLRLRPSEEEANSYKELDDLEMVLVNTGENGLFTKGEFQAITYMRQMEYITPEEIARQVVLEVTGSNTGYDVIAAVDGAAMNPTYRAGYIRQFTIEELDKEEENRKRKMRNYSPSVALGELGPPQLGKLLWEAHLLDITYRTLSAVLAKTPKEIAKEVFGKLKENEWLCNTIVSVGLPILTPNGKSLIRGPYIRIPEEKKKKNAADISKPEDIDEWAAKGWVDLRPDNMKLWRSRFRDMQEETERLRERGSAAFTHKAYLSDRIQIGAVVGWIFNNEVEDNEVKFGYRIK
jgi:hypothetical protein